MMIHIHGCCDYKFKNQIKSLTKKKVKKQLFHTVEKTIVSQCEKNSFSKNPFKFSDIFETFLSNSQCAYNETKLHV